MEELEGEPAPGASPRGGAGKDAAMHYAWNAATRARQAEIEKHGGTLSPTLVAVGGVSAANASGFRAAGVDAFGLGTSLYSPGAAPEAAASAARAFLGSLGAARQ